MLALAFAAPVSAAPYLSVSKSGGFAGESSSLTVSASGRARTTESERQDAALPPVGQAAARAEAARAGGGLPASQSTYGPQNCSDAFEYGLSHGGRDVTIIYCQPTLPRGLAALLDDVSGLLP